MTDCLATQTRTNHLFDGILDRRLGQILDGVHRLRQCLVEIRLSQHGSVIQRLANCLDALGSRETKRALKGQYQRCRLALRTDVDEALDCTFDCRNRFFPWRREE